MDFITFCGFMIFVYVVRSKADIIAENNFMH